MAKLAINLLGYLETDLYSVESLKEVLEHLQFDVEDIEKLGVVVSELPEHYAIIDKKLIKQRIRRKGSLEDVIARRRAAAEEGKDEEKKHHLNESA
jgi:hypothetical protein